MQSKIHILNLFDWIKLFCCRITQQLGQRLITYGEAPHSACRQTIGASDIMHSGVRTTALVSASSPPSFINQISYQVVAFNVCPWLNYGSLVESTETTYRSNGLRQQAENSHGWIQRSRGVSVGSLFLKWASCRKKRCFYAISYCTYLCFKEAEICTKRLELVVEKHIEKKKSEL